MGKKSILNKKQKVILEEFSRDPSLSSVFYFTGGTALSEFYLQHRESEDLDFFSQKSFDPQLVLQRVETWSKKYDFRIKPSFVEPTHIYILNFSDGEQLKIDFAYYPYPKLAPEKKLDGVLMDSFLDIGANKLLAVNQRTEVKDFVDLYFILQNLNFWQLRDGVKAKFNVNLEPYLTAADYLKVADFEFLPKMLRELSLETLKEFFQSEAKKLGHQSVN